MGKLLRTVRRVRSGVNKHLRVTGVIACMHDARTCLAQEILDEIKGHFGRRVFRTVIRKNIRLAEAPGFGLPISRYDPDCHGAEDYSALAGEVIAMEVPAARGASRTIPVELPAPERTLPAGACGRKAG